MAIVWMSKSVSNFSWTCCGACGGFGRNMADWSERRTT